MGNNIYEQYESIKKYYCLNLILVNEVFKYNLRNNFMIKFNFSHLAVKTIILEPVINFNDFSTL